MKGAEILRERERDRDKYMSKGSNLKPRSNQDKRGRRTEKITA